MSCFHFTREPVCISLWVAQVTIFGLFCMAGLIRVNLKYRRIPTLPGYMFSLMTICKGCHGTEHITGKDGNPTSIFFRMLFPERQLQKPISGEMVMESRLGA
jgi:hypothetical protein